MILAVEPDVAFGAFNLFIFRVDTLFAVPFTGANILLVDHIDKKGHVVRIALTYLLSLLLHT